MLRQDEQQHHTGQGNDRIHDIMHLRINLVMRMVMADVKLLQQPKVYRTSRKNSNKARQYPCMRHIDSLKALRMEADENKKTHGCQQRKQNSLNGLDILFPTVTPTDTQRHQQRKITVEYCHCICYNL